MKILVLADIHANWVALQALRESFDHCLVAGDLVDYGPDPAPCIEWVRTHATAAVRGNHDHSVAHLVAPRQGGGLRSLARATRPHHWQSLGLTDLRYLGRLPIQTTVTLGAWRFALVHGTPRDPLDEYLAGDLDAWQARTADVRADFLLVGHTHRPFHLKLPRLQIVNPGSLGQPRDGLPQGSYAVIDDGVVTLHRLAFDLDRAVEAYRSAGFDPATIAYAESLLRSGGQLSR